MSHLQKLLVASFAIASVASALADKHVTTDVAKPDSTLSVGFNGSSLTAGGIQLGYTTDSMEYNIDAATDFSFAYTSSTKKDYYQIFLNLEVGKRLPLGKGFDFFYGASYGATLVDNWKEAEYPLSWQPFYTGVYTKFSVEVSKGIHLFSSMYPLFYYENGEAGGYNTLSLFTPGKIGISYDIKM